MHSHKNFLRKKRTVTFWLKVFPMKNTNIKYKYEAEQEMQQNSNKVLKDEIKMTNEQKQNNTDNNKYADLI